MVTVNDVIYNLRNTFRGEDGFYYFFTHFWDTIIPEELNDNWHIRYICNELQKIGEQVAKRLPKEYDYYIFNVPPGSSKSTIISEMYPLWCWTIDPTQRFICASSSSTIAEDLAGRCYNIYQSDKFREMYPELVEKSGGGKTNFKNGLKGERFTTSASSVITGVHAHQKILDDILGSQQAASKTERDSVNKWLKETISSRNVDAEITTTIIVMQRLHEDDPTGHLLANPNLKIKHVCIPAELSEDVKPVALRKEYKDGLFDPVRKPKHVLEVAKADLGSYGYAGQMQQRPAPEGGGIIKKEWLKIINNPIPPNTIIKFQIDPAYTEKTTNDPTAIVGYYTLNNQVFVTSAISVYKEFPDLILWLPEYLRDNGYTKRSMIYTEPKASGKSIVQQIQKTTNLNIKESDPPKDDKLTRVHIVSPKIESERIGLHYGAWNDSFISQLISFPKALHDDEVDCLVAIIIRELMQDKPQSISWLSGGL